MQANSLEWMYNLERFGVQPGLVTMERVMELLGHPERGWPIVHIAGTNGKGSTAAFMASVLREAGYSVGLYTSPHLVKFNERIQINGVPISDADLATLAGELREKLEKAAIRVTFFEFTTALAFSYFARQGLDIAVIEVGMGGRLDATNVLKPLVSVITNISYDHESFLGTTLQAIASEKAGIIKPGVPVVTGEKNKDVIALFAAKAHELQSDFQVVADVCDVRGTHATLDGQTAVINGEEFMIPLLGKHQLDNAATAYVSLGKLRDLGWRISPAHILAGFQKTIWPGRMQVVSKHPLIVVDGAHNEDGAACLYDFIKDFPHHDVLVLAVKKGKNPTFILERIVPLFTHVLVTEGSYEPWPAEELAQVVRRYNGQAVVQKDVKRALGEAREMLSDDGFMLVAGSLYMIGQAIPIDSLL